MQQPSFSRRHFLNSAALVGASTTLFGTRSLAYIASDPTLVRTSLGALRGEAFPGGRVFRGVPYATPPVGPLRFRTPLPLKPWSGERDATHFSASPLQGGEPGVTHSEDCLALNLWTPEKMGPHPVFVWIHGGGFTGGHAFEPVYDGSEFARQGIVCITVGYRLGVFGFVDFEAVLGPEYAGSANNGLRDIIAALGWIREHVADFGGDPDHVTVGGESAGAKLTDILMGVPSAVPLFRQMISESGGAERVWPRATAQTIGSGFADTWRQLSGLDNNALLSNAGETLLPAQKQFLDTWPQHFPLRPEIDGALLAQLPIKSIAAGATHGKRLLIGTNRDESSLFIGAHPQHDPAAKDIGNISQTAFAEVFAKYAALYPDFTQEQLRIRALTAEEYWVPSIRVVNAHVNAGGQAWMYELQFAETRGRLAGYAYHSLDVGMVWDKPHVNIGDDAQEAALAAQMHLAWAEFIRGKTPAAAGLPAWPEYRPDTRPTLMLDSVSAVERQPQQAELQLWDSLL